MDYIRVPDEDSGSMDYVGVFQTIELESYRVCKGPNICWTLLESQMRTLLIQSPIYGLRIGSSKWIFLERSPKGTHRKRYHCEPLV